MGTGLTYVAKPPSSTASPATRGPSTTSSKRGSSPLGKTRSDSHIAPGRLISRRARPPGRARPRRPTARSARTVRARWHEVITRHVTNIHLRNRLVEAGRKARSRSARRGAGLHLRRRDAVRRREACACDHRRTQYGSGSSRDWRPGPALLGVRVVTPRASSDPSPSLVGMGVLPAPVPPGETATLGRDRSRDARRGGPAAGYHRARS